MARGVANESSDGELAELFFLTHELLSDEGFVGYEVSNFASAPEHRSLHNQKYWDHTPYLGIGPSAHSFAGGRRWWNRRKLRLWQAAVDNGKSPVEADERPSPEQLALEVLMLGFRTAAGVDLARLHSLGFDLLETNGETIDRLKSSGHLDLAGGALRPTLQGLAVADTLARSFKVLGSPTDDVPLP